MAMLVLQACIVWGSSGILHFCRDARGLHFHDDGECRRIGFLQPRIFEVRCVELKIKPQQVTSGNSLLLLQKISGQFTIPLIDIKIIFTR